jgi:polysaccharide biosynthesis protein PslH
VLFVQRSMKALLITPRFPWPPFTGDRLRAAIWVSALAQAGDVALVSPQGMLPLTAPAQVRVFAAARSLTGGLRGAEAVIRHGLPLQCLLAAPFDWKGAIDRARHEAGPFDVTIVVLSRMHPWVKNFLTGRTLLDAVDSLKRNASERARAAGISTRWLWKSEERRMARLDREVVQAYDQIVVVSEEETSDFGHAVAVTNGVATHPLTPGSRAFDFGFWGRFPYFANADAALWLLNEIWPAIRALHPAATLVIGGADAPRSLRNLAERRGVTLVSPVENMSAFARNIRVALMPLRYGSGQSSKVLEAAEAGCAIAGTPEALRGLAPLALHSGVERDAGRLARAAVELLTDETRRSAAATALRSAVENGYERSATLDRLAALAGAEAR